MDGSAKKKRKKNNMDVQLTDSQKEYRVYLQSDRWKKIRTYVKKRDKHKCRVCGKSKKYLEVHHVSYENSRTGPLHKEAGNCITLCRQCHRRKHNL